MCTVTWMYRDEGFILTSNRDEAMVRSIAIPPGRHTVKGRELIFPTDSDGGGTWIAAGADHSVACLLNGAFKPHQVRPSYRISRGHVIPAVLASTDISDFLHQFIFDGIQPFTLIVWFPHQAEALHEIRWDEKKVHHAILNAHKPGIWSSVTLYPKDVILHRERRFTDWLHKSGESYDRDRLLNFHATARFEKEPRDEDMNPGIELMTVSTTCIEKSGNAITMLYEDHRRGTRYERTL